jgi:hypothetical protein
MINTAEIINIIGNNIDKEIRQWKVQLEESDDDIEDERYYIEKDGIKKELELLKYKIITEITQKDKEPLKDERNMIQKIFKKKDSVIERGDLKTDFNSREFEHLDIISRLSTINENQKRLGYQIVVYNILIIIMLLVTKLVIG